MIYGKLSNNSEVNFLPEALLRVIAFLKKCNFEKLESGKRYDIDRDNLYMMINEYHTKELDQGNAEQHRAYIDVQYVFFGKESVGVSCDSINNKILKEYDSKNDAVLYESVEDEVFITLKPGMFVIFFPEDIHRPGLKSETCQKVKKAVIKVRQ